MLRTTIITALFHETRKSLQLLEALAELRAANPARAATDPLHALILRRRRHTARLRTLLRAEDGERTQPPAPRPTRVDEATVAAAEERLLALLDRQLARPDLPGELRMMIAEHREDMLQATLILSRMRDRNA